LRARGVAVDANGLHGCVLFSVDRRVMSARSSQCWRSRLTPS
jgi:hypothetical protein